MEHANIADSTTVLEEDSTPLTTLSTNDTTIPEVDVEIKLTNVASITDNSRRQTRMTRSSIIINPLQNKLRFSKRTFAKQHPFSSHHTRSHYHFHQKQRQLRRQQQQQQLKALYPTAAVAACKKLTRSAAGSSTNKSKSSSKAASKPRASQKNNNNDDTINLCDSDDGDDGDDDDDDDDYDDSDGSFEQSDHSNNEDTITLCDDDDDGLFEQGDHAAADADAIMTGNWQWTDEEQVIFRPVDRIHVNDKDSALRVTEARLNGIPICLVGHSGWPQFAQRWILPQPPQSQLHEPSNSSTRKKSTATTDWLDLSQPHQVNVQQMMDDIGHELVPLVRPDYDEGNPCQEKVSVSAFLNNYWKKESGRSSRRSNNQQEQQQQQQQQQQQRPPPKGYLHQWQFPLSATAAAKLCNMVQPLPNDIFGEDLLRYWLDDNVFHGDSPFQYLFMGDAGTMSKLHRDNGGLAISIAPIVGEKECVMVHRSDGANCMYHLAASLDDIDLHQYPLMSHARLWKTIVRPGEILIMPQGTFHQCRNLTPCLSYSRFHLDTVNLRPFLESWMNRDAKEIEHSEVIWNASCALWKRVDQYTRQQQQLPQVPPDIVRTVNTLRALRNICRAIVQRLESVNGSDDGIETHEWHNMVHDVDLTLHEFRYRHEPTVVPYCPPRGHPRQNSQNDNIISRHNNNNNLWMPPAADGGGEPSVRLPLNVARLSKAMPPLRAHRLAKRTSGVTATTTTANTTMDQDLHRTVGFIPKMDQVLSKLHNVSRQERDCNIADSVQLTVGTSILVQFHGKRVLGNIVHVVHHMSAAYISFEGYGSCYDEYQSFERLRTPSSGDYSGHVHRGYLQPGAIVLNCWGDDGEEYRAVVSHTRTGTFYMVELKIGKHRIQRWITRDMIIKLLLKPNAIIAHHDSQWDPSMMNYPIAANVRPIQQYRKTSMVMDLLSIPCETDINRKYHSSQPRQVKAVGDVNSSSISMSLVTEVEFNS